MPRLKIASRAAPLVKATGAEFGALESRAFAEQARKIDQAGRDVAQAVTNFGQAKALNDRIENTARTDAAVAEVSAFATRDADRATTDPDFHSSEATHVQNVEAFVEQQRATIGGNRRFQEQFDNRVLAIRSRSQMTVRHDARTRQHQFSLAQYDRTGDLYLQQAGDASGPDRVAIQNEYAFATQRMIDTGAITSVQGEARVSAFDSNLASADVRRGIRDDPGETGRVLLGGGFPEITDPNRRELLITQSLRAEDTRLRRLESGRTQSETRRIRQRKATSADAYGEGILMAAGDEGLTEEWLEENQTRLQADPDNNNFEKLAEVVANGGFLRDTRANPEVYLQLLDQVQREGTDALNDARGQWIRGSISQNHFEDLQEATKFKNRYPEQLIFLKQSLDVSEAQLSANDRSIALARSASAERTIRAFSRRDPDASQEAMWAKVEEVSRSAAFVTGDDVAVMNLPPSPKFVVNETGSKVRIDIAASAGLIMEAAASGQITGGEEDEQLARLDKIDKAQQAQEVRRNAAKETTP